MIIAAFLLGGPPTVNRQRSADLQVCCISRTKVLHYIKAGVACRRIMMAMIIAKTAYNFP